MTVLGGVSDPEGAAQRVLEEAKAELQSLGESWDGYRVDVELIATLRFNLWVQPVADLRVGDREYAAFLNPVARVIAVAQSHHPHRRRFSIAHEIGHFVLHCAPEPAQVNLFRCSSADMDISRSVPRAGEARLHVLQEWEANRFAGELLMPRQALLAMYRATSGRVPALAKHFNVSPQAMEIRLSRLPLPFPPKPR